MIALTTLKRMTTEEFRQKLAGLKDDRASGALSSEGFRDIAVDFAVALCLAFNRRQLDPKTLWTRLDSAIQKGISDACGGDIHALINAACAHVLAPPNAMVSPEFEALIAPMLKLDEDESYAFVRYLAKSRYTLIVFARKAWEERKELKKAAQKIDHENAESESEVTK